MVVAHHPAFAALRQHAAAGPVVVAHRGDSENHPENTLPAFESALHLGVAMQEFDVRSTRDGVLVCVHDETFDRTSDASRRYGPGALVAETTFAESRRLDAGSWRGPRHAGANVPSLAEVLDLLVPECIAMIEHKAGTADQYLAELARRRAHAHCILQSFDWSFVATAKRAVPDLALALLGPTTRHPTLDDAALDTALAIGAGMIHWHDRGLRRENVASAHAAGLLVCTYTTDDDIGFLGGAALGLDAMCTNRPTRMLQLQRSGVLQRASQRRDGTDASDRQPACE